jgi:hypothetical protein
MAEVTAIARAPGEALDSTPLGGAGDSARRRLSRSARFLHRQRRAACDGRGPESLSAEITGGRLGDIFGRKAVFMIGLAGFALASMICGLAESPSSLIGGDCCKRSPRPRWRRRRSPRSTRCFLRTSAAAR